MRIQSNKCSKIIVLLLLLTVIFASASMLNIMGNTASAEIISSGGGDGNGTMAKPYIKSPWNSSMTIREVVSFNEGIEIKLDPKDGLLGEDRIEIIFTGVKYQEGKYVKTKNIEYFYAEVTFFTDNHGDIVGTGEYGDLNKVTAPVDTRTYKINSEVRDVGSVEIYITFRVKGFDERTIRICFAG